MSAKIENFFVRTINYLTEKTFTTQIERRDLLNAGVAEGLKIPDMVKYSNEHFKRAIICKNPIIYDAKLLKELVGTTTTSEPVADSGTEQKVRKPRTAKTVNLNKTGPQSGSAGPVSMVEKNPTFNVAAEHKVEEVVHFDVESINASNDPSINSFVKTRSFANVERLLNQKHPVNVYIFGETGVGKTASVLVVGRKNKRVIVRVNCSFFTDVDDLFGGIRIENGNTIVHKGPILMAMELGAILLIDEIDRLNPQVANELFPVLEGKGYLIKKLNKMIYPAEGFCVVGTGNSRGRGDMTGNYNTQILDKALLDRFPVATGYDNPTADEMVEILNGQNLELPAALINNLAAWYTQINISFKNGAVTDVISPRRLIEIAKSMDNAGVNSVVGAPAKRVLNDSMALIDDDVSAAFLELWANITASGEKQEKEQEIPF